MRGTYFLFFFLSHPKNCFHAFCHFSFAVRMFHGHISGFFHVWAIYLHRQKMDIFDFHVWVSLFHTLKKAQQLPTNQGNFKTRQIFFLCWQKWRFQCDILNEKIEFCYFFFHVHRIQFSRTYVIWRKFSRTDLRALRAVLKTF